MFLHKCLFQEKDEGFEMSCYAQMLSGHGNGIDSEPQKQRKQLLGASYAIAEEEEEEGEEEEREKEEENWSHASSSPLPSSSSARGFTTLGRSQSYAGPSQLWHRGGGAGGAGKSTGHVTRRSFAARHAVHTGTGTGTAAPSVPAAPAVPPPQNKSKLLLSVGRRTVTHENKLVVLNEAGQKESANAVSSAFRSLYGEEDDDKDAFSDRKLTELDNGFSFSTADWKWTDTDTDWFGWARWASWWGKG